MSGSQQHQLPAAAKQARLLRQASVLHELQESQEKDSLVSRYARLMVRLLVYRTLYTIPPIPHSL